MNNRWVFFLQVLAIVLLMAHRRCIWPIHKLFSLTSLLNKRLSLSIILFYMSIKGWYKEWHLPKPTSLYTVHFLQLGWDWWSKIPKYNKLSQSETSRRQTASWNANLESLFLSFFFFKFSFVFLYSKALISVQQRNQNQTKDRWNRGILIISFIIAQFHRAFAQLVTISISNDC